MRVTDLLITLTRVFFVILALITLNDYLRRRDKIRRDVALVFLCLSANTIAGLTLAVTRINAPWITQLASLIVIAQPYLLVRLVKYFRPVPASIERLSLVGLILSWIIIGVWVLLGNGTRLSPVATLLIVIYFAGTNGYSVFAFVKGSFSSAGVTRQRLTFAAAGSALLSLVMVIAGLRVMFPSLWGDITPFVQSVTILSSLSYYLGFAPPRFMRQTWQLAELRTYLLQGAMLTKGNPGADIVSRLRQSVTRAIGSSEVVVLIWNEEQQRLILPEGSQALPAGVKREDLSLAGDGMIKSAWGSDTPRVVYQHGLSAERDLRLMEAFHAETVFLVPVATRDRTLGLLMVFMEYGSLFVDDDLNLLAVFAQYTATLLENEAVLEELRRYTGNLERMVRNRTDALQRSNEELQRFAYVASHDLREPLRTVTSYLQLLKERYGSKLDNDADEFIAYAVEGSMRMKDLIDSLLMYSRVETQQQNFTVIELGKVLSEVNRLMKATIDESGATITSDPLPAVRGDQRQLVQLLQNLIGNAIKYQNGKTPEIRISVTKRENDWLFAVKDNGIGIEPQYLERIFVIFQRLHNRTQYPGAGIGLAICRKVVEHHGGRIWAESEKGAGTTFFFTLPFLTASVEKSTPLEETELYDFGTSTGL